MESITIEGFACGPVHFPCNSWIQSKKDHPGKRILFSNKVCVAFLFFFPSRNYALLEKARYG